MVDQIVKTVTATLEAKMTAEDKLEFAAIEADFQNRSNTKLGLITYAAQLKPNEWVKFVLCLKTYERCFGTSKDLDVKRVAQAKLMGHVVNPIIHDTMFPAIMELTFPDKDECKKVCAATYEAINKQNAVVTLLQQCLELTRYKAAPIGVVRLNVPPKQ